MRFRRAFGFRPRRSAAFSRRDAPLLAAVPGIVLGGLRLAVVSTVRRVMRPRMAERWVRSAGSVRGNRSNPRAGRARGSSWSLAQRSGRSPAGSGPAQPARVTRASPACRFPAGLAPNPARRPPNAAGAVARGGRAPRGPGLNLLLGADCTSSSAVARALPIPVTLLSVSMSEGRGAGDTRRSTGAPDNS